MRKHRLLWLAGAVVVGLSVYAILPLAQHTRSGITRANFERIQDGMTEAEVEEVLGGPSGLYTARPVAYVLEGTMFRRLWIGDEGSVTIELNLDEPQRVVRKQFDPLPPESLAEQFRRWRTRGLFRNRR